MFLLYSMRETDFGSGKSNKKVTLQIILKTAYNVRKGLLGRKRGNGHNQGTALQKHPADIFRHLKLLGKTVRYHQRYQECCIVPNSVMDMAIITNTNFNGDIGNFLEVEIILYLFYTI